MPRQSPNLHLSKLLGGIDRFGSDPNKAIDALDVYDNKGDLCRRPSFKPIATGPVYYLPCGAVLVGVETISTGAGTAYADRDPTLNYGAQSGSWGGGTNRRLWIGCNVPFDGFDWPCGASLPAASTSTNNTRAAIKYLNGSAVKTQIYGVVDTTRAFLYVDSTHESYGSGQKDKGRISWNRNFFDSWTAQVLSAFSNDAYYWIAYDLSREDPQVGETLTLTTPGCANANLVMGKRGIRCFLLNPINGMVSTKSKGLSKAIFAGGDFRLRRGHVQGGGLGIIRHQDDPTENVRLLQDEGAGTIGAATIPTWAGGTTTRGTANAITNERPDIVWETNQFDGSAILEVTPNASSSTSIPLAAGWEGALDRDMANLRAQIKVSAGGGPPVGEEREIWKTAAGSISIYPNWSAPLNGSGETIEIRQQPSFAQVLEHLVGREYEIASNTASVATLGVSQPYQFDVQSSIVACFEIYRDCFWALNPGRNWCFAFDSTTGNIIATNGENGLLEWDGRRTRRLQAIFDATDGVEGASTVQLWRGILFDLASRLKVDTMAGSQLHRSPPNGKYIVDFNGRLVVANIRDREQSIQWSAPLGANNLWPFLYDTQIRDAENNPITGLATLYDRLVCFTQTSIHVADQPDEEGLFYFRPIAQGVGFTSHHAVAKINLGGQSVLIGPAPDGVGIFDGNSWRYVLDRWDRIIPGGVNQRCLYNAVGAANLQENAYYLAVPGNGQDLPNLVLRLDYSNLADLKWWLWTVPQHQATGVAPVWNYITSMAHDFDESGAERILFGHYDGHISELVNGDRDGGEAINASARSAPMEVEQLAAFTAAHLRLRAMGPTPSLTLRSYLAKNERFVNSQAKTLDSVPVDAVLGTDKYGTTGDQYAGAPVRDYVFNLPSSLVGEMFDFEIRGTERFHYKGGTLAVVERGQRTPTS